MEFMAIVGTRQTYGFRDLIAILGPDLWHKMQNLFLMAHLRYDIGYISDKILVCLDTQM